MKRWWLLSAIGAVGAVVLLQLSRPDSPPAAPKTESPTPTTEAQPLPAVQVERLLIRADLVPSAEPEVEPVVAAVSLGRPDGANGGADWARTRAGSPSSTRSHDTKAPPPVLERAKRALLGDGRHRPEPFPRVKDN
jgi:hypothetical protein